MALKEPLTPDAAKRIFLDGLGADQALHLKFALRIYALDLEQLGKPGPLKPIELGWQFLTIEKGSIVAGEVSNEPDDPNGEFSTSLVRGTTIDGAWKAYDVVKEHLDELKNEPMELRRLRISPLKIDAFWLTMSPSESVLGARDRVYAFASFEKRLNSQLLPAPEFEAVVREMAKYAAGRKLPPKVEPAKVKPAKVKPAKVKPPKVRPPKLK
ncbi:MAG: hypothetical protein ABI759_00120 [Candidatus Solibacter sp.]